MVQKLKLFFASVAMSIVPMLAVALPVNAQAPPATTPPPASSATTDVTKSINDSICEGAEIALGGQGCTNDSAAATTVSKLIKQIINIISVVVGVVAVIMIIIGGLRYITSGGDSSSVSSAKNTILYAIVGLVVVALAQLIVRFVIGRLNSEVNAT